MFIAVCINEISLKIINSFVEIKTYPVVDVTKLIVISFGVNKPYLAPSITNEYDDNSTVSRAFMTMNTNNFGPFVIITPCVAF